MKKILILALTGVLLLSVVGCESKSKNKVDTNNTESSSVKKMKSVNEKINLDNSNQIDIEIGAGIVNVKSYDGDEVKVTGEVIEKSKGISLTKDGAKIKIVQVGNDIKDFSLKELEEIKNDKSKSTKFDILIPSKFKGDFKFEQGVGSADIQGIKVKDMDITAEAATSKLEDIKFDNLKFTSEVGESNINLKEKSGNIDIKGEVGKVNLTMAEVGGNLKFEGGTGAFDLKIPQNAPVKFKTNEGVGKCNIDAKTSGVETYNFDFNIGVGAVNVRN